MKRYDKELFKNTILLYVPNNGNEDLNFLKNIIIILKLTVSK